MNGELTYLRDVLGRAVIVIRDKGIRQIHIYSVDGGDIPEHHIDLTDVPSEQIVQTLYDMMENDEALKHMCGYRSVRVEFEDKDDGSKEMIIAVAPIIHVFKKPELVVAINRSPFKRESPVKLPKTFREVLQEKVDAAKAYLNKYNEVK